MVWGAEVVPQAVDDAIANAQRNHIENARFLCADAGEAARHLEGEGCAPDVVCVDPPARGWPRTWWTPSRIWARSGWSTSPAIRHPGPGREAVCRAGYTLKKAVAVDMFPRTAHVETVARLERS